MDSVFENVSHNKAFPAKIFVTQVSRCAFHWHHDYELILILKGTVTAYCGAEPTTLSAGDLFLINTKAVHGIQRTAEDNLILCLQFSPQLLESNLDLQQFFYHFYLNSTDELYLPQLSYQHFRIGMVKMALTIQKNEDTTALRCYSQLLSFLADLVDYVQFDIRRSALSQNEDSTNEFCNKILSYIDHNLQAPNLAQDLCRHFGMSEKSLYRYLKTTLGLSFKELYDIVRVEKACFLLQENRKSISIIWELCGFSSEVSFYRNFKKQMGVTPKEYRKGGKEQHSGNSSGESYDCFNLGEATGLLYGILNAGDL